MNTYGACHRVNEWTRAPRSPFPLSLPSKDPRHGFVHPALLTAARLDLGGDADHDGARQTRPRGFDVASVTRVHSLGGADQEGHSSTVHSFAFIRVYSSLFAARRT